MTEQFHKFITIDIPSRCHIKSMPPQPDLDFHAVDHLDESVILPRAIRMI
jgi:hypothetical protein